MRYSYLPEVVGVLLRIRGSEHMKVIVGELVPTERGCGRLISR